MRRRRAGHRTQTPQTSSQVTKRAVGYVHRTLHQNLCTHLVRAPTPVGCIPCTAPGLGTRTTTVAAATPGGVGQGLMGGGDQNKGWHPSGLGDGSNTELEKRHKFKSMRHFGLENKVLQSPLFLFVWS